MYKTKPMVWNREVLAYLVGIALGDGNLSNLNGRCVRLRISCDLQYPFLITQIIAALQYVLPESAVNIVNKRTRCLDLCSYSVYWEDILGWKASKGSKFAQSASVPKWIWYKDEYIIACLKGLLETDGSIYNDRGYPMVMFANIVPDLAKNVFHMMKWLGFRPRIYNFIPTTKFNSQRLYHVRLSSKVPQFLGLVQPLKA
jgi:hypothetical protein